ncbi:MAG: hypothetical protein Q8930_07545 [Bacillota bacterium]|nr:hypothetical protein [Bacillota bacterium]
MKRRKKPRLFKVLLMLLMLLIVASCIIIYLIQPVKNNLTAPADGSKTIGQYFKSKAPESVRLDRENKLVSLSYSMTEIELTEILLSSLSNSEVKEVGSRFTITGMSVDVGDGVITVCAGIRIFYGISSQVILKFLPQLDDGTIVLTLLDSKLGRLPLPKDFIMNMAASSKPDKLMVSEDRKSLLLINALDRLIKIKSLSLSENTISFEGTISLEALKNPAILLDLKLINSLKELVK